LIRSSPRGGGRCCPTRSATRRGCSTAVICISGLDALEERQGAIGIPASITRDTLSDVELWMNDAKQKTGQWGCKMLGSWLILHCQGRLFRLGRLQFEMSTYSEDWLVLKHRASGRRRCWRRTNRGSMTPGSSRPRVLMVGRRR
jgi:hypothetical protein